MKIKLTECSPLLIESINNSNVIRLYKGIGVDWKYGITSGKIRNRVIFMFKKQILI